jgi:hypothetical protein
MTRYRKTIPRRCPACGVLVIEFPAQGSVCFECQGERTTTERTRNYLREVSRVETIGCVTSQPRRLEPSNNEGFFTCVNQELDLIANGRSDITADRARAKLGPTERIANGSDEIHRCLAPSIGSLTNFGGIENQLE